jgi:hypothetical protein
MHKGGTCRRYTPEEIRFIKKNITGRSYTEMTDLFNKHFGLRGKKKIPFGQMKGILRKHKLSNGLPRRFLPGCIAANRKPVGTESYKSDRGYIIVKTADPDVWKYKHIVIWENAHGPVPEGHVIMFADGNKQNLRLSNLLMVSRKELGVMNRCGLISTRKDLTKTGKLVADIKIMVSEKKHAAKKGRKSAVKAKKTRGKEI